MFRKGQLEFAASRSYGDTQVVHLLQRPAFAIRPPDEPIGLGAVAGLQVLRVPLELLAGAEGDRAQQVVLDQRAGVVEVAERRRAGLAGVDPFL